MNPTDAVFRFARVITLALLFSQLCTQTISTVNAAVLLDGPDLVIAKTHTGDFYQGQVNAWFKITVTNTGDAPYVGGLLVVDSLPQGLVYTTVSDPLNVWHCTPFPADHRVECTRSISLPPGASNYFYVYVRVQSPTTTLVTNTVDLTATGDVNPANNHAEDPVTVLAGPDLSMLMTVSSNSVRQGDKDVTYTLTVSNIGTGPTNGTVTVTDNLPVGLIPRSMQGNGWSCVLSSLTCTRSDPLPVKTSYPTITLAVEVAQNAPSQVENRAAVAHPGDINPMNNADQAFSKVREAADLIVTIQHDGDFRQGQPDALYRLWVTNTANGPTVGPLMVKDLLPGEMEAVSMEGSGWDCTLASVSCTYSGVLVSQASTPAILLRVRVAEDAPPQVTNYATVSGGGEFETGNNSAADPTTIVQIPDLTIAKTHTGSFYQNQDDAQYTITVSNVGAGPVFGDVLVQEYAPNWLTIKDMSGPGWSCDMVLYYCKRNDDTGLPPGGSYPPITVTVHVSEQPYVLEVTNVAEVSLDGERNTANNRAEDRAIVAPYVDLEMKISQEGAFAQGQKGAKYLLELIQIGKYPPAAPVTVTNTLPAGLIKKAISGEGWQCVLSTLTCTYADVPDIGEVYPTIMLTVDVAADAPPLVENRARVTARGDINPGNDEAVYPTDIHRAPDLTLGMMHTGYLVRGKQGSAFVLTVTNQGGPTSAPVTLTNTLPLGLSAVRMEGEGWTCVLASLTCTRADLLHGGFSYPPVILEVAAAQSLPAEVTNRASVEGGGETNTANNADALTVPVYTPPSVTLQPRTIPGCLGLEVVFHVEGAGVPAPEIQWQVSPDGDRWANLEGEDSDDLRFVMGSMHVGKLFRAVLHSAAGEAVSQSATVDLHGPLEFVLDPAGQSVEIGQPINFQVEVAGQPLVSLTWQISPDGAAWQAIPGASGKNITFIPQAVQDGWLVRAEASNACGAFPSRPAQIRVAHRSVYLPMLSR